MSTPVSLIENGSDAAAPVARHESKFDGAKVTFGRVVKGEWIKFRSLRSSWVTLLVALLICIGLGSLFSHVRAQDIASGHSEHGGGISDPTMLSLRGIMLAQLAAGVLGVLFIASEYSTGMIRSTLSAVPGRAKVLAAKSVVIGVVMFVCGFIASLVAFLLGQHFLNAYHYGVSLSSNGSFRAVVGAALYLTLIGLLGLGCGFIFRSTGGAIAVTFLIILVLPLLGEQLPSSWGDHINPYLPMNAGMQGMTTHFASGDLGAWQGLGVMALWSLGALLIGGIVLQRRDA